MVSADKAEVCLVRYADDYDDRTRYEEFIAPYGNWNYTGNRNERFVAVVPGERYCIRVKLLEDFDWMGSTQVEVLFYTEHGQRPTSMRLSKTRPAHEISIDLEDEDIFIGGQETRCALTFGDMVGDEDVVLNKKELAKALDQAGRITVKLSRGKCLSKKAKEFTDVQFLNPPEHVDQETVPNKVIVFYGASLGLKHVPLGPTPVENASKYNREFKQAEGPGSEPIVFTLRYRTEEALLSQGITLKDVPRSIVRPKRSVQYPETYCLSRDENDDDDEPVPDQRFESHDTTGVNPNPNPNANPNPDPSLQPPMPLNSRQATDIFEPVFGVAVPQSSLSNPAQSLLPEDRNNEDRSSVAASSGSCDTTGRHFVLSVRPSMSPAPSHATAGTFSRSASKGPAPAPSVPRVTRSLLSGDDEDKDKGDELETREGFSRAMEKSHDGNKTLGTELEEEHENRHDENGTLGGDDSGDSESDDASNYGFEMVGSGCATPRRGSPPVTTGPSAQKRKRVGMECLQFEDHLQVLEAKVASGTDRVNELKKELEAQEAQVASDAQKAKRVKKGIEGVKAAMANLSKELD